MTTTTGRNLAICGVVALVMAGVVFVGVERDVELCEDCLAARRHARWGVVTGARWTIPASDEIEPSDLQLRAFPPSHVHRWTRFSSERRTLVLSETGHGRFPVGRLLLALHRDSAGLDRIDRAVAAGEISQDTVVRALSAERDGRTEDADYLAVNRILGPYGR